MRACTQCGKCCLEYGGSSLGGIEKDDLVSWFVKRPDILDYIEPFYIRGELSFGDAWFSPTTGEELTRCPWLRKLPRQQKYRCRIYEDRPKQCREYPASIDQMIEDGCEMLEEGDLERPRIELIAEVMRLMSQ